MNTILLFFLYSLIMEGVFGESVLVKEGDSVTLHTGLTEIQTNYMIEWRFGAELFRIARIRRDNDPVIYDEALDGKFRGRLKLNSQTADLTITNIKTTDTGVYKVSNSINTLEESFNVTVKQYEVGGIQSVSVLVGDSVTLQTDAIDIRRYNMIWWRFECEKSPVAEINRTAGKISASDGADGRFRHRLQLDYLTGSLTIKNIGTKHSGLYEVDISSSSKHTIHKTFNVTVSGEIKSESVMVEDSVTLQTYTDIQIYDLILWMLRDIVIAEIHKAAQRFFVHDADGRFKDRLQLNSQTGDLTITNTRTTDSGVYELKISSSRHTIHKKIIVTVIGEIQSVSVRDGDSVTLHTDLTQIQRDDQILWMFIDTRIAEMCKTDKQFYTHYGADERFRGRLQLDNQTGSLTIMNIRTSDSGFYELKISSSRHSIHKRFTVAVTDSGLSPGAVAGIVVAVTLMAAAAFCVIYYRRKIYTFKRQQVVAISVANGQSVTLKTDAEIQNDNQIRWLFGNQEMCIAQIKGDCIVLYDDVLDGRFIDKLKLDNQTGSLTITDITTHHNGFYKLQIIRSGKVSSKIFSVTVSDNAELGINDPEGLPLTSVDASNS